MRLLCSPSRASKNLRTSLAFLRNGPRRYMHDHPLKYDVAVIGAGITGLTAAYRLSKDPLCSKVTLYERASRVGGWIQSETISVDGGDIVFEYGPRTLRVNTPTAFPLLDLITDLQLEDQILLTSNSSPASQNRYIYYPYNLVRLPSPQKGVNPIRQLVTAWRTLSQEPLFENVLRSVLSEPKKGPPRTHHRDVSVMDFVSRRWCPELANNLVSSLYHGIFAGDIDKLSADTLLGGIRCYERNEEGVLFSMIKMASEGKKRFIADDLLAMEVIRDTKPAAHRDFLRELAKGSSTLTFKNGVGQLVDALVAELNRSDKVEVLTNANVTSILQDSNSSNLTVEYGNGKTSLHDRLIATNPAPDLARQLQPKDSRENTKHPSRTIHALLSHNYAVTTMVVNLYYPNPHLLPVRGFGYLIPRSVAYHQNPEQALGVIFASESSLGQDSAPGTKITVMMGGYYWDGWKESDYPDHDTSVAMAQSLLKRHLGITDSPTVARTRLQRDAIPQPTVGHLERMGELSHSIKDELDKRVTLAGAWYSRNGTGVVDAIRQAYLAAAYGVKLNKPGKNPGPLENTCFEGGIFITPTHAITDKPAQVFSQFF